MDLSVASDVSEMLHNIRLGYGNSFGLTKDGSCVITDDAVSGVYGADNYIDSIEKAEEFGVKFPDGMRLDGYNLPIDRESNKAVIVYFSDDKFFDGLLKPMNCEVVLESIKKKYSRFIWISVHPWLQDGNVFSKVFFDIYAAGKKVTFKKLYGTPYLDDYGLDNIFSSARSKMKRIERDADDS